MSSDHQDDEEHADLPIDDSPVDAADSADGYGLDSTDEQPRRRASPPHLLGSARIRPIGGEHEIEPLGTEGTYSLAGNDPPQHVPITAPISPRAAARVAEANEPHDERPPPERSRRKRRSTWQDFRARMSCNLIVFVSSLCVMVLELTASRLIADDVGQSLYTWTSVIGVVLAGITIGNLLGGWLADRFASRTLIPSLLFAASVLCVLVLVLDETISGMDRGEMGWQTWIVVVTASLFLAPAVALGTIAPPVAALALRHSVRDGSTVGNVYAWGALGSIVGTFLTGFYLVDHLGSRSIIWLTSGTLAATAALCAAGMWAFRAAICLGWLQFLTFVALSTSATRENLAEWGRGIGRGLSIGASETTRTKRVDWWASTFGELGADFRQLGLTLRLRDDADPTEYRDESNYATIRVTWDPGGETKSMRIDKLVHSRWNPSVPIRPQARYERIYAGVTEAAAAQRDVWTGTALSRLPAGCTVDDLPAYVRFDSVTGRLELRGAMTSVRFDELLALSEHADYLRAVRELRRASRSPSRTGFSEVPLETLPEGTSLTGLAVVHDRTNGRLRAFHPVDDDSYAALLDRSEDAEYVRALERLLVESRGVRTFFIGGGGFVMPRWIDARFPGETRIDVAELDPAVVLAARRAFGLPSPDRSRIVTHIGDARQIVDDFLREHSGSGDPPSFDFVYGDAFNDYGVPWHLTTREFAERIRSLLAEDGVYLVNLIDQLPRTEFPAAGEGYAGRVPPDLYESVGAVAEWSPCPAPFEGFEVRNDGTEERPDWRFAVRGVMSNGLQDALRQAGEGNPLFVELVEELSERSQHAERGRFLGRFAATLADIFPCVYVFSSRAENPAAARDTLVVVASLRRLSLTNSPHVRLYWPGDPFAWRETAPETHDVRTGGQWDAVIGLADGLVLTDDFAPVDNLLLPLLQDPGSH